MISYLVFCHKDGDDPQKHALVGREEGFARVPQCLKEILLGEGRFEGSAILNGQEILGGDPGSVLSIEGGEVRFLHKKANKIPANSVQVAQIISKYKAKHFLRIDQELLIQKVLYAVFQEVRSGAPFVYLDLERCGEAAVVLDALKSAFPEYPLLFSLPPCLDFALPEIDGQADSESWNEIIEEQSATLGEASQAFFKELVGLQSADPEDIPAIEKEEPAKNPVPDGKKPRFYEERKGKKAAPTRKQKPKKSVKKPITPEVKKNVLLNLGFVVVFFTLSAICPYLFFWFSESSSPVYFTLYLILQVFFLAMTVLPTSYIDCDSDYLPNYCLAIIDLFPPVLSLIQALVFYFVAKSCEWTGYPVYVFIGVALGFLLLYPALLFAFRKINERSAKKK